MGIGGYIIEEIILNVFLAVIYFYICSRVRVRWLTAKIKKMQSLYVTFTIKIFN